jgi:hypothetical protein
VLSHRLPKQADQFTASQFDTFDQADDHPHVRQHRRSRQIRLTKQHPFQSQFDLHRRFVPGWLAGRRDLRIEIRLRGMVGHAWPALAAAVESFLLAFSGGGLIVRGAALARTPPTMVLPAPEGTTQIPATRVPRMREKPDPAVNAVNHATLKLGMRLQGQVQGGLILPDKRPGAVILVPIRPKREKLLDGYGKKARFSVMMRIDTCTPSSLPHRGERFERKGEVFCALRGRTPQIRQHRHSASYPSPSPCRLLGQCRPTTCAILKRLPGRRKPLLLSK